MLLGQISILDEHVLTESKLANQRKTVDEKSWKVVSQPARAPAASASASVPAAASASASVSTPIEEDDLI